MAAAITRGVQSCPGCGVTLKHFACKALAEQMEKKNGWLLFPLGIALSGKARTPGGGTDLAAMMGREETLKRVKDALGKL